MQVHDVGNLVQARDPREQEFTISAAVCGDVEMENVQFPADRCDPELRERKGDDERSCKNAAVSAGSQPRDLNIKIRARLDPFRDKARHPVNATFAAEYGHEYAKRFLRLLRYRPGVLELRIKWRA